MNYNLCNKEEVFRQRKQYQEIQKIDINFDFLYISYILTYYIYHTLLLILPLTLLALLLVSSFTGT